MPLRESAPARAYYRLLEAVLLRSLSRVFSHPNHFTVAGVVIAALTPLGFYLHPGAGLGVMLASALADSMDGLMARETGLGSRFGAFLDSSLDRISDFFFLAGFWVLFMDSPDFMLASFMIMAAIVATILISYTKARAEGLGGVCEAGLMGRAQRIIYLAAWAVVLIALPSARHSVLWWGLSIYTGLTSFTVAQRIYHVKSKGFEDRQQG